MLYPDDGEFARGPRNLPNRPLDLDGPEARTDTEFACIRGDLMKDEVRREGRSGRQAFSAVCRVVMHTLLKQPKADDRSAW